MKEKSERIKHIKDLLLESDMLYKTYSNGDFVSDYSKPVLTASMACESILEEILIVNGIEIIDGVIKINDKGEQRKCSALTYCLFAEAEAFIPVKIQSLIRVITIFRNKSVHYVDISQGEMFEFFRAFTAFKSWAIDEIDFYADCDKETVTWFLDYKIDNENRLWIDFEYTDFDVAKIEQLRRWRAYYNNYNKLLEKKDGTEAFRKKKESETYLEQFKNEMIEYVSFSADRIINSIDTHSNELNKKIDNITDILNNLSNQIYAYQELVQNQIDLAVSEDEIERIVGAYTNTCAQRIITETESKYSEKSYDREEEKLKVSLGEKAWNKLSDESKRFLVSSKVTYNYLINIKSAIDYSGVCLLVTKALELEMKRRFYDDYVAYLKNTYPGKSNYCKFPNSLLDVYGHPIRSKEFTLGRVPYTLCAKFGNDTSDDDKRHDRDILVEYTKKKLFKDKENSEILDILENYGEEIGNITTEYRNKAAHINELRRINAEQCFDLVLDVEKLLKRMLDSFEY